jgi:ADP-ribose pyrophosphatase YjhB (NUDIX family)
VGARDLFVFRHLLSSTAAGEPSAFDFVQSQFGSAAASAAPLFVLLNVEPRTPGRGYPTRDVCMAGGSIDLKNKETPRVAALREIKEEMGLDTSGAQLLHCIQCGQTDRACACSVKWQAVTDAGRPLRRACEVVVFVAAVGQFHGVRAAPAADTTDQDSADSDGSTELSSVMQRMQLVEQSSSHAIGAHHCAAASAASAAGSGEGRVCAPSLKQWRV